MQLCSLPPHVEKKGIESMEKSVPERAYPKRYALFCWSHSIKSDIWLDIVCKRDSSLGKVKSKRRVDNGV